MLRLASALVLFSLAVPAVAQSGFQAHTYSAPVVQHVKAVDFNRDGYPDLLTSGGPVDVYLNDGHGGLLSRKYVGVFAAYADVADFNNDGLPDIATCHINSDGTGSTIGIYLNRGSGSFSLASSAPLSSMCTSLTTGDVDHDGKMDVVTTSYTYASATSAYTTSITTFFGSGTGTLPRTVSQSDPAVNAQDASIYACHLNSASGGDFDQAGRVDLVLIGACSSDTSNAGTIYYGTSDGAGHYSLKEITEGLYGYDYFPPYTADVNGDGKPDVVIVDYSSGPHASWDNNLEFLINKGAGSFALTRVYNQNSYAADYLSAVFSGAAADFNGDGIYDAVAGFTHSPDCCTPDTPGFALLNGTGNNNYAQSQSWTAAAYPYSIATADFNKDGKPDFAAIEINSSANSASLVLYLNTMTSGCSVPSSAGVHVCSPLNGGTYSSPVKVSATGKAASGSVVRLELWIDGKKYSNYPGSTMNASVSMSAGSHRVVVVEADSNGGHIASSAIYITAQ